MSKTPKRFSERVRNQSGKDFRKPDFVYEDPLTSSKSLCAFTKLGNVHKKGAKTLEEIELVNAKRKQRIKTKSVKRQDTAITKDKQLQLSQQRIDLLFSNQCEKALTPKQLFKLPTELDLSSEDKDCDELFDHETSMIQTEGDADVYLSMPENLQLAGIAVTTNGIYKDSAGPELITQSGEDTIVHDSMALPGSSSEVTGNKLSGVSKESADPTLISLIDEMQRKLSDEIAKQIKELTKQSTETITTTVTKNLEESMSVWQKSMKQEFDSLKEENRIFKLNSETTATQCSKEVSDVTTKLQRCQEQIQEMSGYIIKQDQVIKECKSKLCELEKFSMRNILCITGLKETEEQNCIELVQEFFTNQMSIGRKINLNDAHWIGKGKDRVMLAYLTNPKDKWFIFSHSKNLKEKMGINEKPYQVREQLPAKEFVAKQRQQQVRFMNKKREMTATHLQMTVEKSKLKIEGKVFREAVQVTDCKSILCATQDTLKEWRKIPVHKGNPVVTEGQTFTGFTACIKNSSEVQKAYDYVKSQMPDARHVICAYRMPGRNFHELQGYVDDDEWGAGAFVFRILEQADIQNRAIFVARQYDGTHIGKERFSAIEKAVKAVLTKTPYNKVTGDNDYINTNFVGHRSSALRGRGGGPSASRSSRQRGSTGGGTSGEIQGDDSADT